MDLDFDTGPEGSKIEPKTVNKGQHLKRVICICAIQTYRYKERQYNIGSTILSFRSDPIRTPSTHVHICNMFKPI